MISTYFNLTDLTDLADFTMRIGFALLLGSLIGAEREWRNKLAGLKTNALVCVGAALFTYIGYHASVGENGTDPTRIAGQIASGIGFLGAGAILRDGMTIRGLTTAATVWCAAAIGAMAGAGLLLYSVVGTLFIMSCNMVLKKVTHAIFKHHNVDTAIEQNYILNFYTSRADLSDRKDIVSFFKSKDLEINAINIEPLGSGTFHWILSVQCTYENNTTLNTEDLADTFWTKFNSQLNWKLI